MKLFLGIFIIILLAAVAVFFIYYNGMTTAVFSFCLKRNVPDKWQRGCSDPSDNALYSMDEAGKEWAEKNTSSLVPLETINDKLRLSADYYDLHEDKVVMIIPPLYETSSFSRYFAKLYANNGFNVFLPDCRSTGNSAGEYLSAGFYESDDILTWAELLNRKYGINRILLHGISSGAVAVMLAACNNKLPNYIKGAIYEGIYADFETFFKAYMEKKRYNTMVHKAVMRKMRRYIGVDTAEISPINFADKAALSALFISGNEDSLIKIEDAKTVFDIYGSSKENIKKEFHVINKGENGNLRYFAPDDYDRIISGFINKL